jgi:hypothetical protein
VEGNKDRGYGLTGVGIDDMLITDGAMNFDPSGLSHYVRRRTS